MNDELGINNHDKNNHHVRAMERAAGHVRCGVGFRLLLSVSGVRSGAPSPIIASSVLLVLDAWAWTSDAMQDQITRGFGLFYLHENTHFTRRPTRLEE